MQRTITALALAALGSLGSLAMADAATAHPVDTGCPAGFEVRTVAEWEALDARYQLPAEMDDADLTPQLAPFDGVAGNEDGLVCGLELPPGFTWGWAVQARGIPSTEAPDIFYSFQDNNLPAYR